MAEHAQNGIDEVLGRWRQEVKDKKRRIISFEETIEIKINSLKKLINPETVALEGWEFREFIYTRKREKQFHSDWAPIKVGDTWGGPDGSAEFRCKAQMPEHFAGQKVALKIYFSGDGLLYVDGKPYHGLDPFRDTVLLTDCAAGDESYNLEAEAYIFWHFGESEIKRFECSHFATIDQEMSDIYWDFKAAYNVLVWEGLERSILAYLKAGFDKAIWMINQNESDPVKARENAVKAREILRREVYETDRFQMDGLMHLCGNSHLDVVFLWTHAEFVRKLGRTHASTLRLMEQYPDYIFSQSQPLMYHEMKENYPTMFEEVKERVKEGRWEVIGAFWVEPDCNLISGESFVRQIQHGVKFLEQEFDVTPRTCWCPDVFGNAWTMPQILKKSGLEYFVTHKMGTWNDTNKWTKHDFWWQGPDGSRVFSLMPPTHFIGTNEPYHLGDHWELFSDKETVGESMYNYGWGDGGGGPDPEMLEYMKRYKSFPGMTPTKPNTIENALDSIHSKAKGADLPIINDELYLEEHRGVYTTKGHLKKLNRYCEILYRKAEMWSCFADLPYPADTLDAGWKHVLTNQFHDSLPGTHIPPVYLDLLDSYAEATQMGESIMVNALKNISDRINTTGEGIPVVVFNSLAQERHTLVKVDIHESNVHVLDPFGNEIPSQFISDFETGALKLAFEAELPQAGYAVYWVVDGKGKEFSWVAADASRLENENMLMQLNSEGEVVTLVNKCNGFEVFSEQDRGNVFKLYEDVPGKYEAWDIAPTYTKVEFDIAGAELKLVEQGPVCATIEVTREFMNTKMKQWVRLTRSGKRVDFHTWVDWHEQQKLLKVRFFTPIVTRTATYDIAYGNIERSTYRSNSFDEAKFEVSAHQWMDISQPDNGLSLLNDCKYGHEALEGMIALTLLRGTKNPDPESDQEEHFFTYSLYPHAGGWREAHTIQEAADLNDAPDAMITDAHEGSLPGTHSFLQLNTDRITLEAVKKAEFSDDLIVRVVDRHGATSKLELELKEVIEDATLCNLLEREDEPVDFSSRSVNSTVNPYEIQTFKISR